MFVKERVDCFKERLGNFLGETETAVNKQFPGYKQARKNIVKRLEVLEVAETIIKEEEEKLKEILRVTVGFDFEETGELPEYKQRKVEIDDSPTAYA